MPYFRLNTYIFLLFISCCLAACLPSMSLLKADMVPSLSLSLGNLNRYTHHRNGTKSGRLKRDTEIDSFPIRKPENNRKLYRKCFFWRLNKYTSQRIIAKHKYLPDLIEVGQSRQRMLSALNWTNTHHNKQHERLRQSNGNTGIDGPQ